MQNFMINCITSKKALTFTGKKYHEGILKTIAHQ